MRTAKWAYEFEWLKFVWLLVAMISAEWLLERWRSPNEENRRYVPVAAAWIVVGGLGIGAGQFAIRRASLGDTAIAEGSGKSEA